MIGSRPQFIFQAHFFDASTMKSTDTNHHKLRKTCFQSRCSAMWDAVDYNAAPVLQSRTGSLKTGMFSVEADPAGVFDAEGAELKDEMLACLYFWLHSAGLASTLCLVRGHRAASSGTHLQVDSTAFGDLVHLPKAVAGVALNEGQLRGAKLLPARAGLVDSLMYM